MIHKGLDPPELLAPKSIKFYNADWKALTGRADDRVSDQPGMPLWEIISRITGISIDKLRAFEPGMRDIRRRLGWASKRHTTRVEDLAYCLIGIFDIGLRIAYGEGKIAFRRLQVEIMRDSNDKGLFMWNGEASPYNSMLAAGPGCFSNDDAAIMTVDEIPCFRRLIFDLTNKGLRIPLSLHDVPLELDYELVGGETAEVASNDSNEFFKLGVLGYSSSNPLVILLRGRTYGSHTYILREGTAIHSHRGDKTAAPAGGTTDGRHHRVTALCTILEGLVDGGSLNAYSCPFILSLPLALTCFQSSNV